MAIARFVKTNEDDDFDMDCHCLHEVDAALFNDGLELAGKSWREPAFGGDFGAG